MKTNVMMQRKLLGSVIEQRTDNGFFNATQLVSAGDRIRAMNMGTKFKRFNLYSFLNTDSSKAFISELELEFGKVKFSANKKTWVHPLLFIDIALAIDPKLKVQVYKWLYDELVKYRTLSGDSYRKMAGALYARCTNKARFSKSMKELALLIRNKIGVRSWESATEGQLKQRDKLQDNITLLANVLRDNRQATRLALENFEKTGEK